MLRAGHHVGLTGRKIAVRPATCQRLFPGRRRPASGPQPTFGRHGGDPGRWARPTSLWRPHCPALRGCRPIEREGGRGGLRHVDFGPWVRRADSRFVDLLESSAVADLYVDDEQYAGAQFRGNLEAPREPGLAIREHHYRGPALDSESRAHPLGSPSARRGCLAERYRDS
jgi:hypothetical protein